MNVKRCLARATPTHYLANFGNNPLASCIKGEATLKGTRSLLSPYGVSFLAVGSALLLTLLLQPLLKPTIFLLFFAAVAVSAWYRGMEAGLMASALSTLAVNYFFLEPVFSLSVANLDSIRRLGLFVLVTTFISLLNSELRTAKQHLQISLQKLEVSEAKLRRLVESNIIGIIVANMDGAIAEANDAFLQMVGYSQEDLVAGRIRWRDMISPKYIEANDDAIAELKAKGVCQPFENEYIRKDETCVPILLGSALLENNSHDIISFVLDLSERKQSEKRLKALTEKVRIIPWEVNANTGNFTYVGPQTVEILGYPLSDWYIDDFWEKHIHPEDREWAIKYCQESSLTLNNYEFEYRMLAADGRIVWLYDIVNVVRDENGPQLLHGFMLDITDVLRQAASRLRKQAEQEREQTARTDAEAASRLKDEFLATLSHELRTPLNAILGWTQLLRSRKFDETTTARALETIERNTRSLAQLIEDVLDVSRFIRGTLHLNMHRVKLVPLVEAAIDTVRPAAEAKEISINTRFDPEVGVIVGDSNRLQQVVWNLLSNAVKFTPKGGRVDVQLERIESSVQIRVSDTGVGIAAEFLPHIFERFRQADSSSTRSHGGLGLGLAIVRHLVELHGGTVSVESPGIGQGATFIVNLPMKAVYVEANTAEQLLSIGDVQEA
jgi:PAS domain S-box-containing protein